MHPLRPGDPERIGAFSIVGLLGEGPRGEVFLGHESEDAPKVAIKLLPAEPDSERELDRYLGVKRVSSSYVARVLDAGYLGDRPYIVREYVEGKSLAETVAGGEPLKGDALERVAVGVLTALSAVHLAGLAHRALTPHNVILSPDGPRVTDAAIGDPAGDPAYQAPEQLKGLEYGPYADVFAWAATIVYAGTGRPPFADEEATLNGEPDVAIEAEPLRRVLLSALTKEVGDRPTTYSALMQVLGDAPAPNGSKPASAAKPKSASAAAAGVAADATKAATAKSPESAPNGKPPAANGPGSPSAGQPGTPAASGLEAPAAGGPQQPPAAGKGKPGAEAPQPPAPRPAPTARRLRACRSPAPRCRACLRRAGTRVRRTVRAARCRCRRRATRRVRRCRRTCPPRPVPFRGRRCRARRPRERSRARPCRRCTARPCRARRTCRRRPGRACPAQAGWSRTCPPRAIRAIPPRPRPPCGGRRSPTRRSRPPRSGSKSPRRPLRAGGCRWG
ncbi:serine/threonine-protein kinase [Nonomuraea sp. N2-4H]|uniref:serine/threonine-protein kinase n=1 Tax=Nonomuraea sp. N2-4H TaxID=3128898 RepID=UPI0032512FBD